MPRLESVAVDVPPHPLPQAVAKRFARSLFAEELPQRYLDVFDRSGVRERRLARPLDWYLEDHGWEARSHAYAENALDLSERAARHALGRAGLTPEDVDAVVVVSTTGVATPSLDARLVNRLGLPDDVQRTPLWGLGCAGGCAGLNRAADLARARPGARVLLVAVELCSLSFQLRERDVRSLVATSLFGDGAAACIVSGDDAPDTRGPRIRAGATRTWPHTEDVMGWDVQDEGFSVVLAPEIPDIVRKEIRPLVEDFLHRHDLALEDVAHYAFHPGGTKVLDAFSEGLGLPPERFALSRSVLRDHGNMSSPTVLAVLERALHTYPLEEGDVALAGALGPGFTGELTLLEGA